MQGFDANTYKWCNQADDTVLVKCIWQSHQGTTSLTEADVANFQADDTGHASKDLS